MAGETIIAEVWVTKYALTKGIERYENVRHCTNISADMIAVGRSMTFHGNEWHRSEEAAKARAREMAKKKIASIDKQRDNLICLLASWA